MNFLNLAYCEDPGLSVPDVDDLVLLILLLYLTLVPFKVLTVSTFLYGICRNCSSDMPSVSINLKSKCFLSSSGMRSFGDFDLCPDPLLCFLLFAKDASDSVSSPLFMYPDFLSVVTAAGVPTVTVAIAAVVDVVAVATAVFACCVPIGVAGITEACCTPPLEE